MYPLDTIYGPRAYNDFHKYGTLKGEGLKQTLQRSLDIYRHAPIIARSYAELVETVSFFSVMNKRHTLYFRGQATHAPLRPAIFRSGQPFPCRAKARCGWSERQCGQSHNIINCGRRPLSMLPQAFVQLPASLCGTDGARGNYMSLRYHLVQTL